LRDDDKFDFRLRFKTKLNQIIVIVYRTYRLYKYPRAITPIPTLIATSFRRFVDNKCFVTLIGANINDDSDVDVGIIIDDVSSNCSVPIEDDILICLIFETEIK
jgi:hypothetical protein